VHQVYHPGTLRCEAAEAGVGGRASNPTAGGPQRSNALHREPASDSQSSSSPGAAASHALRGVVAPPSSSSSSVNRTSRAYEYTCVGGCETPAGPRQPRGGVLMAGGSTDVAAGFEWMSGQADGGNLLVLRATGTGAYNDFIYGAKFGLRFAYATSVLVKKYFETQRTRVGMGGVHSAATIVLRDPAAANDDFVVRTIEAAHGIFFAGGNQWNYMGWAGSRLQQVVQAAITQRRVPVGGTSAGLAILGSTVFTAENGGVTSEEALSDPFSPRVALSARPFLEVPFLSNVITDQHFRERDRMGRALTFMARISQNSSGGTKVR
jgi:cyanophycinase